MRVGCSSRPLGDDLGDMPKSLRIVLCPVRNGFRSSGLSSEHRAYVSQRSSVRSSASRGSTTRSVPTIAFLDWRHDKLNLLGVIGSQEERARSVAMQDDPPTGSVAGIHRDTSVWSLKTTSDKGPGQGSNRQGVAGGAVPWLHRPDPQPSQGLVERVPPASPSRHQVAQTDPAACRGRMAGPRELAPQDPAIEIDVITEDGSLSEAPADRSGDIAERRRGGDVFRGYPVYLRRPPCDASPRPDQGAHLAPGRVDDRDLDELGTRAEVRGLDVEGHPVLAAQDAAQDGERISFRRFAHARYVRR